MESNVERENHRVCRSTTFRCDLAAGKDLVRALSYSTVRREVHERRWMFSRRGALEVNVIGNRRKCGEKGYSCLLLAHTNKSLELGVVGNKDANLLPHR